MESVIPNSVYPHSVIPKNRRARKRQPMPADFSFANYSIAEWNNEGGETRRKQMVMLRLTSCRLTQSRSSELHKAQLSCRARLRLRGSPEINPTAVIAAVRPVYPGVDCHCAKRTVAHVEQVFTYNSGVDQPVKIHIERIQRQIEELTAELPDESDLVAHKEAESHIRSLRLALAHFQLALEIEDEVRRARSRTNS